MCCAKLKLHFLYCSERDVDVMKEFFIKYDGTTAILEEDHGFKLIFHQRDFMPGNVILFNMVEAVDKSRRMIMMLSK